MDPREQIRRATDTVRKRTGRPRSRRLTFAFDERGVRLHRSTDRLKAAPVTDPLGEIAHVETVVAEVRTANGETIYRKQIPNAFPADAEIFDPDGTMHREPVEIRRGVFTVIVPIDRRADHVLVDAGPLVRITQFEVAGRDDRPNERIPLGRFPLEAQRTGGKR